MTFKYKPSNMDNIVELAKQGKTEEVISLVEQEVIDNNLLVISLQDESSAPKVFYKGKEIKWKQNVFFDWDTDTEIMGGLTYAIEHAVTDEGHAVTNRIERRVKGHAT